MSEPGPGPQPPAASDDAEPVRSRPVGGPRPGGTKGRRGARYGAVQQTYSALLNPRPPQELVLAALASDHLRAADRSYLQSLIHGVAEQREALDGELMRAIDRDLSLLDAMEHAVLLVGTYELMHEPTLPAGVVINEAVELAKTFGATDGHRYVNGVLDKLARRLRSLEYAAG